MNIIAHLVWEVTQYGLVNAAGSKEGGVNQVRATGSSYYVHAYMYNYANEIIIYTDINYHCIIMQMRMQCKLGGQVNF